MRFLPSWTDSGVIGGQGLDRSEGSMRLQSGVLGPGDVNIGISSGVRGGGEVKPRPDPMCGVRGLGE